MEGLAEAIATSTLNYPMAEVTVAVRNRNPGRRVNGFLWCEDNPQEVKGLHINN